jgi:hypothetical protein
MDRDAAISMLSIFPPAGEEIATKRDLTDHAAATRHEIAELRRDLRDVEQRLTVTMHREFIVQTRWMTGVVVGAIVSITAAVLAWG